MLALLFAVTQSTNDLGEEVAEGSGAVFIVGFVLVSALCVIGAAIHRKRKG